MTNSTLLRLLAPIVFTTLPLVADSLTGKLTDPQGATVAKAEVSLFSRTSGRVSKTTTSETGEFSFPDVAGGRLPALGPIDAPPKLARIGGRGRHCSGRLLAS